MCVWVHEIFRMKIVKHFLENYSRPFHIRRPLIDGKPYMTYAYRIWTYAYLSACMRARAHTHTHTSACATVRQKNEILIQISRGLSSGDAVNIRLHAKLIGLHADLDSRHLARMLITSNKKCDTRIVESCKHPDKNTTHVLQVLLPSPPPNTA